MVYLIENPIQNICKIGCSVNPEDRLAALQTASPNVLRLRATLPGGYAEEKQLHEKFRAERLGGEWFTLTDAIMQHFDVQRDFWVGPNMLNVALSSNGSDLKVLLWVSLYAGYNSNTINLGGDMKEAMASELNMSLGSIDNALSRLVKKQHLHRLGRGVYHMDPTTTWRGDLKSRAKNIQVFLNYTIENP